MFAYIRSRYKNSLYSFNVLKNIKFSYFILAFILLNNMILKIFLDTDKSAAASNIHAGSLEDPINVDLYLK